MAHKVDMIRYMETNLGLKSPTNYFLMGREKLIKTKQARSSGIGVKYNLPAKTNVESVSIAKKSKRPL